MTPLFGKYAFPDTLKKNYCRELNFASELLRRRYCSDGQFQGLSTEFCHRLASLSVGSVRLEKSIYFNRSA